MTIFVFGQAIGCNIKLPEHCKQLNSIHNIERKSLIFCISRKQRNHITKNLLPSSLIHSGRLINIPSKTEHFNKKINDYWANSY